MVALKAPVGVHKATLHSLQVLWVIFLWPAR